MYRRQSRSIIALGFVLVLALLLGVAFIGLQEMRLINRRLREVIDENSLRTELVFTMHYAARERALLLFSMALTQDPFSRESQFTRFNRLATEFTVAREQLLAMNLSPEEKVILARQSRLIAKSESQQKLVANLIITGKIAKADALLLSKTVPAQNAVLKQLRDLLKLQMRIGHQQVLRAENSYHYAYLYIISLGALAVVLCTFVALFVIRRVTQVENALFQEKELAETTLHSIGDAVMTVDIAGNVDYTNPVTEQMTGWGATNAQGLPLQQVLDILDEKTRKQIEPVVVPGAPDGPIVNIPRHSILRHRDGNEFIIEAATSAIRDRAGRAIGSILVFRDVTQAHLLAQQLTWQATHDPLTGLVNRRDFEHSLAQLLESAKTHGKHHALLYIDLDQFKVVNDTCGHVAGDELLRQLATILGQRLRGTDVLARLGGDEFGVLLESCPAEQAPRIANNLLDAVRDFRFIWLDKVFEVGLSIGLVVIDSESRDVMGILSAADEACYTAKDNGRNRVHVYRSDDRELVQRRGEMRWIARIGSALEEKRFRLFYQTISPLAGPSADAYYEILLRMLDEEGNIVPPMAFIPAAERYRMMPSIDRWVIRNLFNTQGPSLRNHVDQNGVAVRPLCAVNLSGTSISDDAFRDFVQDQIAIHRIPPAAICFEITETAAITNLNKASRFMHELKDIGCRFALDDFGTGMSSFAYLKHLPVDFLKIDGSFVSDMAHDPVDFALVEAINRIGHVLGIHTVAESAESEDILSKLRDLGVDYVQGNAIHVPELLLKFPEQYGPAVRTIPTSG
ncbi:MAG: EAL domain-containing protein [Acidiferrobacterales bacterium]